MHGDGESVVGRQKGCRMSIWDKERTAYRFGCRPFLCQHAEHVPFCHLEAELQAEEIYLQGASTTLEEQ